MSKPVVSMSAIEAALAEAARDGFSTVRLRCVEVAAMLRLVRATIACDGVHDIHDFDEYVAALAALKEGA
jgi:hypothetical protein